MYFPKHGRAPKNPNYRYCPDDIHKHLVLFSTFEELKLPISGPMERAGVTKLYERFARGKQPLGGLSVEETDDRKDAAQKVRVERGAETCSCQLA